MPKFDVVVGNPPYQRGLHLDFLDMAYNISSRYILFIQPSTWLISESEEKRAKDLKSLLERKVRNVKLFNGNSIFNVALYVPFSIIYIDKDFEGNLILDDEINDIEKELEKLQDINKWGDYQIFPPIKQKILKLSEESNFLNSGDRQNFQGKYFLELSKIRGHAEKHNPDLDMIKDDFYSFFPRDVKITNSPSSKAQNRKIQNNRRRNWYGFDTLEEAINCLNFLKTRWAMFALSIHKMNQNIQEKEVRGIPWLDWSNPWTEERFEKLINATPEEIAFVKENIPDYYNK